ncbi:MAG: geranylgeranyl reductase, partial [Frankiales bacterium]|nr:geranylgeranyl reductase [Frankiales bacterium]
PLTGEGIFYALLSGRLAGAAALGGPAYAPALRRELGRHLRQTAWLDRLAQRSGAVDAAVRVAGRSPAAFDALVEMGLGRGLVTAPLVGLVTGQALRSAGRRLRRIR